MSFILLIMSSIILFLSWIVSVVLAQKCQINILDTVGYVGCFVDSHTRLLPDLISLGDSTDNSRCILHCRESRYMFAGTQATRWCFCGNNPWKYTAADVDPFHIQDYDCNQGCVADTTQICGGDWRLSVYITGVRNDSSLPIQSRAVVMQYIMMGKDKKINDSITAISSVDVMSIRHCAALCSMNESCSGYVYSTITKMCQMYRLKYGDLCDYILAEEGSSVYMIY